MKRKRLIVLGALVLLTLGACASQTYVDADTINPPGFFHGLLHGFTAGFALIGHIFNPKIRIYAYPNSGGWYDFGFLLGSGLCCGGAGASAARR